MTTAPDERMRELATRLYAWRGRELLGARDVMVWVRRPGAEFGAVGVAFHGDALKMTGHALVRPLDNRRSSLDLSLQRALGMPGDARSGRTGTWPVRQTMSDGQAHLAEVLDAVEQLTSEFLGGENLVEATLMPLEGAPWSPGNTPTPYYSARHGKAMSQRPGYVVEVETRDGPALGADFCDVAATIGHCGGTGVVGMFRSDTPSFLVTHAVGIFERVGGRTPAQTARLIRDCGGLLFPSVAVGVVPATNFGELVLVADVSLILAGLRPYKKRGAWPVVVYETDVWTETTTTFLADGAAELLVELTDIPNYMYKHHFWALGPPVMDAEVAPLTSTKKLRLALGRRAKIWPEVLTEEDLDDTRARHGDDVHRYPYLEAKVNGITTMDCFPLAVCPRGQTRTYRSFLKGIGFGGTLITVKKPPAVEGRDPRWDYAWAVREAVLDYADEKPGTRVMLLEE
jgi:hypothetical protein